MNWPPNPVSRFSNQHSQKPGWVGTNPSNFDTLIDISYGTSQDFPNSVERLESVEVRRNRRDKLLVLTESLGRTFTLYPPNPECNLVCLARQGMDGFRCIMVVQSWLHLVPVVKVDYVLSETADRIVQYKLITLHEGQATKA
jgi:hypothetical protein